MSSIIVGKLRGGLGKAVGSRWGGRTDGIIALIRNAARA